MPDNKKHHYIPQFYLRRFSLDGKSICLWNIPRQKKVSFAPIKNQCYKNYFYGEEPDLEKGLASIEMHIASILRSVDRSHALPGHMSPDHIMLILFVLIQHSRTTHMHDSTNQQINRLYQTILRDHPKTKGINMENFNITMKNAVTIPIQATISLYPIILDLEYKLLRNQTKIEFVTSDNPVIQYNQFYEWLPQNKKFGSFSGLSAKGLQIFVPICHDKLLFLYDSQVYRGLPKNCSVVDITNPQDIYQINALQFCSAVENIYFRNSNFGAEALHKKASRLRKSRHVKFFESSRNVTDESTETLLGFSYPDIATNLHLSFVSVFRSQKTWLKKSTQRQEIIQAEIRNQELHGDTLYIGKKIKNAEYSSDDFHKLIEKYQKK